jgi:hypothetical protein
MDATLDSNAHSATGAASVGRHALTVILSLALAFEATLLVLVAVGTLVKDFDFAWIGSARVGYSPWISASLDLLAAIVLPPIAAVGVVALWQDGWGRRHWIGPIKRHAMWAALAIQVLAIVYILENLTSPVVWWLGPFEWIPWAAFFFAVAVGLALTVRTRPYRGLGLGRVGVIALALAITFGLSSVSAHYTSRRVGAALESSMAPPDAAHFQPAWAVACAHVVDAACAQRAADRSTFAVAWLPLDSSPQLVLLAVPHLVRYAQEATYVPEWAGGLILESAPPVTELLPGSIVQTVRAGDLRGELRRSPSERDDQVEIVWTRHGTLYRLSAYAVFRHFNAADIDKLVALWRSVGYAEPPKFGA